MRITTPARFSGFEEEAGLQDEFRVDTWPAGVREAFAHGAIAWPLAVQRAIAAGIRDVNALTDLMFYMHFPSRVRGGRGQPLDPNEARFAELVKIWKGFRGAIVPLVQGGKGTAPTPAAPPPSTRGPCRFFFSPTAVETPGGGRIRDKTDPDPSDVVMVESVYEGQRRPLHRLAAQAWEAMVAAARSDGLAHPLLLPTSGYRSKAQQQSLWDDALKKYGSPQAARKWVAPPGGSPHQSGRAMDLYLGGRNSSSNVDNLRRLPAYHWLVANAHCFGFYPYEVEPWHWEYNPPAARP